MAADHETTTGTIEAEPREVALAPEWQHQVRIDLPDATAALARSHPEAPELAPLAAILARHRATLICQYDAFAGYCAEAEQEGIDQYPLYHWTKATIEDPAKKVKFLKNFTLYVDGEQVYPKALAAAMVADLQALADQGLVTKIANYDTNPANNPQPPARPAA